MAKSTALVPAEGFGIAFADDLSKVSKREAVVKFIGEWLAERRSNATALLATSQEFSIYNDDDRKRAATLREAARAEVKEIAEFKKKLFGQAKKDIKSTESPCSDVEKTWSEAQDNFDKLLKKDYLDNKDARDQAQDILRIEADKNGMPYVYLPETEKRINTENGGYVTTRGDIGVAVDDKMTIIRAIAKCDLPLLCAEIDLSACKEYFKVNHITDAPGFKITESAIIVGGKT
jgi:hypothetical protein